MQGTEGHNSNFKKNAEIRDAKEAQVFILTICSKYHFPELQKFLTRHMVGRKLEIMFSINLVYIHTTEQPCSFVDTLFLSSYQTTG